MESVSDVVEKGKESMAKKKQQPKKQKCDK